MSYLINISNENFDDNVKSNFGDRASLTSSMITKPIWKIPYQERSNYDKSLNKKWMKDCIYPAISVKNTDGIPNNSTQTRKNEQYIWMS